MTTGTPDLQAVIERLEKLETQNRRIKLIGAVALVLTTAVLLMGQATPKDQTVVAEKFILLDRDGKPRAGLVVRPDGSPGLGFFDRDGKPRAGLSVLASGSPGLSLRDRDEKPRAVLQVLEDGTPSLAFFDEDKKPRAVLGLLEDGTPRLELLDTKGKVLFKAP